MSLTAYLKIDNITGESRRAEHEDEIEIHDFKWKIEQSATAVIGRGRSRSRAKVDALQVSKFTDTASAYLALACMQGKSFRRMTLTVQKDSGDAHLDYLVITMTNATISGFEVVGSEDQPGGRIEEVVALVFENVSYKYTVQADDHSAGDEHEITYDIAAGV